MFSFINIHDMLLNLDEEPVRVELTDHEGNFWFGDPWSIPECWEEREVDRLLSDSEADEDGTICLVAA